MRILKHQAYKSCKCFFNNCFNPHNATIQINAAQLNRTGLSLVTTATAKADDGGCFKSSAVIKIMEKITAKAQAITSLGSNEIIITLQSRPQIMPTQYPPMKNRGREASLSGELNAMKALAPNDAIDNSLSNECIAPNTSKIYIPTITLCTI